MSFQLPKPCKRKLSRASTLRSSCMWVMARFPLPVDEQPSALPSPDVESLFPLGSSWVSGISSSSRAVLSTGEYLAHASPLIWALVPLPAHQFFMKQAGNHKLLSHANDLAPQLKFRPLSNCSLTYFLWWQILNFLMKK